MHPNSSYECDTTAGTNCHNTFVDYNPYSDQNYTWHYFHNDSTDGYYYDNNYNWTDPSTDYDNYNWDDTYTYDEYNWTYVDDEYDWDNYDYSAADNYYDYGY